ncbi:MAG: bifunctional phosphopantothenoylcysteine decarboxylase/phosphopantothenate--cysteine ligase CoaBC [Thermoplasmatales archaeon]|nr:bifunctional phosphopantothenoylcysteine decarboxylase/phosphopantothenate--cysteine ligase CoaBC [Thermoplasmatales archaeon]
MHPAEEIYCEKSNKLRGKTIVMGITGSVAATECFGTIRELVRHGAKVSAVLSREARKMVTPESMEFATGNPCVTELTGMAEHVDFLGDSSGADLFMVYPATANTVSKIANGIDDGPVTSMATVAMGSGVPIMVAPAMHDAMYRNPAVAENIAKLKAWDVKVVGPRVDGGRAKVASRDEIVAWAFKLLSKDDLVGRRILVIGGRSEEPIDSMRMITNRSTGLMALRVAERAFERGADVTLWMGAGDVPIPDYMDVRRFETVADLVSMVGTIDHDVVIVPAALADFSPEKPKEGKIPSGKAFKVNLVPVPKVLPLIRERCGKVIGFKAESGLTKEKLTDRARQRLKEYGLAAVVANDIDVAGKSTSSAIIVTADSAKDITGPKEDVADSILDYCVKL